MRWRQRDSEVRHPITSTLVCRILGVRCSERCVFLSLSVPGVLEETLMHARAYARDLPCPLSTSNV